MMGMTGIPVLVEGNGTVVSSKEKASVLGGAFEAVHRCEHLGDESKRRRGEKLNEHGYVSKRKGESGDAMDAKFSMFEMTRVLEGCRWTAPGEDRVLCDV